MLAMYIRLTILRLTDCHLPQQWTVKTNREYIHLPPHTNKCTEVIYYLNSVLIIHIETLYSFITPTCFDTLCVIIGEHTLFLAKITDW
jgi:hypothetical protein